MEDSYDELEAALAAEEWSLTFAGTSRGDPLFSAEKIFPGYSATPARQSSASARGLVKACKSYDAHKAGDKPPAVDVHRSNIATGTLNTETYR